MPGPSFRPILASLGVAVLFAGLVFGGWVLAVGLIFTIVALLGWLNDARKEYRQVVPADTTGHLENEPAARLAEGRPVGVRVLLVVSRRAQRRLVPTALRRGRRRLGRALRGAVGWPRRIGRPGRRAGSRSPPRASSSTSQTLTAPADKPFQIAFDNQDAATPHDVDILDASGKKVFDGKDFPGPEREDLRRPGPGRRHLQVRVLDPSGADERRS